MQSVNIKINAEFKGLLSKFVKPNGKMLKLRNKRRTLGAFSEPISLSYSSTPITTKQKVQNQFNCNNTHMYKYKYPIPLPSRPPLLS